MRCTIHIRIVEPVLVRRHVNLHESHRTRSARAGESGRRKIEKHEVAGGSYQKLIRSSVKFLLLCKLVSYCN